MEPELIDIVPFGDDTTNFEIMLSSVNMQRLQSKTKFVDIVERVTKLKWKLAGHKAGLADDRFEYPNNM